MLNAISIPHYYATVAMVWLISWPWQAQSTSSPASPVGLAPILLLAPAAKLLAGCSNPT